MTSPQNDILRLLALGNANVNAAPGVNPDMITNLPAVNTPAAINIPVMPNIPVATPKSSGILDSLKSLLPDSPGAAIAGSLAGLAASPFLGPVGGIAVGTGISNLFNTENKKEKMRLGVLSDQNIKALGLTSEQGAVLRSLPEKESSLVIKAILGRKKTTLGPGAVLLNNKNMVIAKNPRKNKPELGEQINKDGTRTFVDLADPKVIADANANGSTLKKLTVEKQNSVLLSDENGNIRSFNQNDPADIERANRTGFRKRTPTVGSEGKPSTKFFDVTELDPEGNFVKAHVFNGDELNTFKERIDPGNSIDAVPIGTEKALAKRSQLAQDDFNTTVNQVDNLSVNASNILDILRKSPAASTFTGGLAEKVNNITTGVTSLSSFLDLGLGQAPSKTLSKSQQNKLESLAKNSAELRSATLELAFTIAALNGQTGRGLSDRDFQIALDIVGSGGDPATVANTLGSLLNRTVKKTRKTGKNISTGRFPFKPSQSQEEILKRVSDQAMTFIRSSGNTPPTGGSSQPQVIKFGRDKSGRPVRLN